MKKRYYREEFEKGNVKVVYSSELNCVDIRVASSSIYNNQSILVSRKEAKSLIKLLSKLEAIK